MSHAQEQDDTHNNAEQNNAEQAHADKPDGGKESNPLPTTDDQDLSEEELRLLAHTMPGEGPAGD